MWFVVRLNGRPSVKVGGAGACVLILLSVVLAKSCQLSRKR